MFETFKLRKVRRHYEFYCLRQLEKCIKGNYFKSGERYVQFIFSTKVVTNVKVRKIRAMTLYCYF